MDFLKYCIYWNVVVQSLSHVQLFAPINCSTPGLSVPHHFPSLPKFISIASVLPSGHLILWWPLLLLPSIFPRIRDFSTDSLLCFTDTVFSSSFFLFFTNGRFVSMLLWASLLVPLFQICSLHVCVSNLGILKIFQTLHQLNDYNSTEDSDEDED